MDAEEALTMGAVDAAALEWGTQKGCPLTATQVSTVKTLLQAWHLKQVLWYIFFSNTLIFYFYFCCYLFIYPFIYKLMQAHTHGKERKKERNVHFLQLRHTLLANRARSRHNLAKLGFVLFCVFLEIEESI